jgi:RNA polymerase sigma factor (sigma-70 family)
MLDQPIDDETGRSTTLVNVIPDKQALPTDEAIYTKHQQLEYIIENAKLYHAVQSLTPKQKQILNASYLLNMTDTEIAAREGVSQQSISKTRKRALRNLKNQW